MPGLTLVQEYVNPEQASASTVVPLSSDTTAGNTLVVCIQLYSSDGATNEIDLAATTPITDNAGNAWTLIPAAEVKRAGTSWYQHTYFAYANSIAAKTGYQITVAFARSTFNFLTLWELPPASYDTAITNTGAAATVSVGSITPARDGAMVFFGETYDGGSGTWGSFTPFTADQNGAAGGGMTSSGHYAQTTRAAVTVGVSPTAGSGANQWAGAAVSFLPPYVPPAAADTVNVSDSATATFSRKTAGDTVAIADSGTVGQTGTLIVIGDTVAVATAATIRIDLYVHHYDPPLTTTVKSVQRTLKVKAGGNLAVKAPSHELAVD